MSSLADDPNSMMSDAAPVEEQIIEKAKRSYERLPLLEVIFERLALSLGPELKSFVGAICEAELEGFDYMPVDEILESLPNPSLIAMTQAEGLDGMIAVILGPHLLISTLEITFGGRSVTSGPWTPRSFTSIEKKIGQKMTDILLEELSRTFTQLIPATFSISHIETNPHSLVLAPPNSAAVCVRLRITMDDRHGTVNVVVPYNSIANVRGQLAQPFLGGSLGGDKGWRDNMTKAISDTSIPVVAKLIDAPVPLKEVLNWKRGQVLDLGIDKDQEVVLTTSGHEMFRAQSGKRKNGSIALRVTERLKNKEEMTDVLHD